MQLEEEQDQRPFPREEKAELEDIDSQGSAPTRKIGPITCKVYFFPKQKGNLLCYGLHDPSKKGNTRNWLTYTGLGMLKDHRKGGSYPDEECLYQDKEEGWKHCIDDQQGKPYHVWKSSSHKYDKSPGVPDEPGSTEDEF